MCRGIKNRIYYLYNSLLVRRIFTPDMGLTLARRWLQKSRLTSRLLFVANILSLHPIIAGLQLPVVFIDSHHDTKEGKEVRLLSVLFKSQCFFFTSMDYCLSWFLIFSPGSRVHERDKHSLEYSSKP